MCGIVGFVGRRDAAPILLEGLSKLEYRGYDSAGLAVRDSTGNFEVVKAKGKLKELFDKTDSGKALHGTMGIGHTRWATHGEPSETNAHPHISGMDVKDSDIIGVHNGIIENYMEMKTKLLRKGYKFYSDTDTEVLVKLVDYYYKKYKCPPCEAIAKTMVRVKGSYALAVMFKDHPDEIWAARKDSPMIVGISDNETFIASDVPAILKYTRNIYYVDNMEIACLKEGSAEFFTIDSEPIEKELVEITWDTEAAEKGGYEYFMMKEIHEQPRAILDTLNSVIKDDGDSKKIDFSGIGIPDEDIKNISQIYIAACGSAWHAGMAAQYVIEDLARVPVRVELASEFRYRKPILDKNGLVIIISQSGETADSIAALREAKEKGVKTLAIVNVVGSTIAREADYVLYTLAGPEIAVATTKAYSAQLIAGYLLAIQFAYVRGMIDDEKYAYYISELYALPDKIEKIFETKDKLQWFAAKFVNVHDVFFIGRNLDYAVSLEGSLKMKEISYAHSEAYAAGELKHGTISMIEGGTLVISVLTQPELFDKTISNMSECKTRGAYLAAITAYGHYDIEDTASFVSYVPTADPHFMGSLSVIPLQLLGYYLSLARGLDADKPRNLAKSVTVE